MYYSAYSNTELAIYLYYSTFLRVSNSKFRSSFSLIPLQHRRKNQMVTPLIPSSQQSCRNPLNTLITTVM